MTIRLCVKTRYLFQTITEWGRDDQLPLASPPTSLYRLENRVTRENLVQMYVFGGKQLPVSYLRPSKIDAAKHSRAILKLLVTRFRQVWPDVKIIFRGDSG